jgi:hypothetical protein
MQYEKSRNIVRFNSQALLEGNEKMGVRDEEKKQGKAPKNILKVHREENFSKKSTS